ncbi:rod shape-determining protein MreC [Leptotrichia sp. OH3620_COT-345]|uniref:rod shape-determining protein MreC n=1 Tax=Leptotrichia sp. OH3620_COT-345 TaxID=2491048 RepID=UPI000F64C36E|nr:rod shape-determining protein MreC [Leptotrichia sp. OH3620_COT-345]RRD38939.1 rod shape-determining protein MreC [Leptotrichia sp. OH3620_COT-345]
MATKKSKNAEKRKNTGRNILIIVVVATVLFIFKDRVVSSFKILDEAAQIINFKLVNVKSIIYKQTLKFKSRIQDINYVDTYIKNNKERDFELQKNKVQNMELANIAEENKKLRTMLEMRSKNPSEYIAADVALVENLNSSERIFIDKGRNHGIILNLPVMYNGFLIGKVSKVGADYSEVTLLTSKNSRISTVINDTDMQILRGNGNGTFSIFNYNENVTEKSIFNIETSGTSDIFPRGLIIGSFYIKDLNSFKQTKELRFRPSYEVYDIQSVLVYKWSTDDAVNKEIQNQINEEIEQEFKKNKGTTQTN